MHQAPEMLRLQWTLRGQVRSHGVDVRRSTSASAEPVGADVQREAAIQSPDTPHRGLAQARQLLQKRGVSIESSVGPSRKFAQTWSTSATLGFINGRFQMLGFPETPIKA
jgi:hypothetical protein